MLTAGQFKKGVVITIGGRARATAMSGGLSSPTAAWCHSANSRP
jgi:hypothetical protein